VKKFQLPWIWTTDFCSCYNGYLEAGDNGLAITQPMLSVLICMIFLLDCRNRGYSTAGVQFMVGESDLDWRKEY